MYTEKTCEFGLTPWAIALIMPQSCHGSVGRQGCDRSHKPKLTAMLTVLSPAA
ncbi:hypothetical protein PN441_09020 [Spirulina major CS-329]|uniref:hypothetical protein n=1 Tax=Spirulina TaxID=1154 RepID=UPI00232BE5F7|nr:MULTISPECIES: hypothetical protein [Spirulina]MDB9496737.1 hypothetical protein [Spirulina subsalsa CS-330]MDB9503212.1 hypothetical protein [Spirulina major CS-329]